MVCYHIRYINFNNYALRETDLGNHWRSIYRDFVRYFNIEGKVHRTISIRSLSFRRCKRYFLFDSARIIINAKRLTKIKEEKNLKMKIAITGANGFIGTNLVEVLEKDLEIETIAMVYPGTDESIIGKMKCVIKHGDMMNLESMIPIFKDCECVVHLAGLVTEWATKESFEKYIVQATKNVFEASVQTGVKKFVFMSSLTVLGFRPFGAKEIEEDDDYKPCNEYARAKMVCEKYLLEEGKKQHIKIIIVRPAFTIFGKYDRASFILYLDSLIKHKVPLLDKGRAVCSFVYSENLAHGIAFLCKNMSAEGIYNISDRNMSWKEFISLICDLAGVPEPKSSVPYRLIQGPVWLLESGYKLFRIKKPPILNLYRLKIQTSTLSCSETRIQRLGFHAPIEFEEGIRRTIEYYNTMYLAQNNN